MNNEPTSLQHFSLQFSNSSFSNYHFSPAALMKHKDGWPFDRPITKQDAPDYHLCVKTPIDLSTIRFSFVCLFVVCCLDAPYTLCTSIKNFSSVKDSTGWDHLLHKKSRDPRRHPTGLFKLFPGKLDHNDDFLSS